MSCVACKQPATSSCKNCKTLYCNSVCQKIDWKNGHKQECALIEGKRDRNEDNLFSMIDNLDDKSLSEYLENEDGDLYINIKNSTGLTPLMYAARRAGSMEIIEVLLENGADTKILDVDDNSVLDHLVLRKTHWRTDLNTLELLIDNGAKPGKSRWFNGIWHSLCQFYLALDIEPEDNIIRLLIKAEDNINRFYEDGDTLLMKVIDEEYLTLGIMLVNNNNYNVQQTNDDNINATMYAIKHNTNNRLYRLIEVLVEKEYLKRLHLNYRYGKQHTETLLMAAVAKKSLEVVRLLVRFDANVNITNEDDGKSTLMYVYENIPANYVAENVSFIRKMFRELLINGNGDINYQSAAGGTTILLYTLYQQRYYLLEMLFEDFEGQCPDLTTRDNDGIGVFDVDMTEEANIVLMRYLPGIDVSEVLNYDIPRNMVNHAAIPMILREDNAGVDMNGDMVDLLEKEHYTINHFIENYDDFNEYEHELGKAIGFVFMENDVVRRSFILYTGQLQKSIDQKKFFYQCTRSHPTLENITEPRIPYIAIPEAVMYYVKANQLQTIIDTLPVAKVFILTPDITLGLTSGLEHIQIQAGRNYQGEIVDATSSLYGQIGSDLHTFNVTFFK